MNPLIYLLIISMPPLPGKISLKQYEKFHKRIEITINKPEKPGAYPDTMQGLVILVDFDDNISIKNVSEFNNLLFSDNNWSLKDYYKEVSYNKLEVDGFCAGWYRMPLDYTDYVRGNYGFNSDEPNVFTLVRDAVQSADSYIDFSEYDRDGDGFVDGLFIVHAGPGAEETGDTSDIWSHKSSFTRNNLNPVSTDDGVEIDVYSMEPEIFQDNSLITIGVFAHEFSHVLGSPDIYDISSGAPVIGYYGLMDAGSWNGNPPGSRPAHPSAWIKYLLGWVNPVELRKDGTDSIPNAIIPSVEQDSTVYLLLENAGGNDWAPEMGGRGEYFMVENRSKIGFDSDIPGSGLVIYHVDEGMIDNTDKDRRLLSIMQADSDLSTSTQGELDDLWKDSDMGFCETSSPPSSFWDGTPSGVSVSDISPSGNIMYADLAINLVLLGEVYAYPNPFIPEISGSMLNIRYVPTDLEEAYGITPDFEVKIFNLTGKLIRKLDEYGEIYPEARKALWNGKDEYGNDVASGIYFYVIETEGEKNRGRFTYVR